MSAGRRWAVVGGGVVGLTLARRLALAGLDVVLCESAGALGGLAGVWTLGDVVWDRHYHVISPADIRLLALLCELGLADDIRWTTTRTGVFVDGRLVSMSNAAEFLRFPALGLVDKARLALTIWRGARTRDVDALDRTLASAWLTRWAGQRGWERFWRPLLAAKLGDAHARVAATFITATIARLYAARQPGARREVFGHVRGGYARILDRLAASLQQARVNVRLGHDVKLVEPRPAGGVAVTFAHGAEAEFDGLVLTVPPPAVVSICRGLTEDERQRLQGVEYVGIVCASLLLRTGPSAYYITNILDPGFPCTGVIDMSALVGAASFGGRGLLYVPRYAAPDDPAFARSDGEWRRDIDSALSRLRPGFCADDVLAFRVSRQRHVFALPTRGYRTRMPSIRTSVPGLYLASTAQIPDGILSVDRSIELAERAATLILDAAAP